MYAEMSAEQLVNHLGDDAEKWAAAFIEIISLPLEQNLVHTWFATAIEASYALRLGNIALLNRGINGC